MTIRGQNGTLIRNPAASQNLPHLLKGQGRVERVREESPRGRRFVSRVCIDKRLKLLASRRPGQISHEKPTIGAERPDHLRKDWSRLGNVMNDGIRDDGGEWAFHRGDRASVLLLKQDAVLKSRLGHIPTSDLEHRLGEVDPQDAHVGVSAAEGDRDPRGAGPDVQDQPLHMPAERAEKVSDEAFVDVMVIHGVVVDGFLRAIHRLGFKNARQHGEGSREIG